MKARQKPKEDVCLAIKDSFIEKAGLGQSLREPGEAAAEM